MAFTNNRPEFRQGQSYTEELHAKALNEGIPSFVQKGLELTGTTLTSGVAINSGIPGQWGEEGETHTITANYTGFIILKTVLDGANGLNSIVEDVVRNDTDPRSTSKTRYFTIYELLNGVIVQDFRHINYVKTFYLKNMGGSNIAWVLNGFTSDAFDASVMAGNRTILSLDELNLDGQWVLGDVPGNIKKAYDAGVTMVGNDKPFTIVQGLYREVNSDHYEFSQSIEDSIIAGYGSGIGSNYFEFSITFGTFDGLTNTNHNTTNFIEIKSNVGEFTRQFDFDDWSSTKWLDEKGYTSGMGTLLYTAPSGYNNNIDIVLSESLLNFDTIMIEWKTTITFTTEFNMRSLADDGIVKARHADTQGYNHYDGTNWYSYTDRVSFDFLTPTSIGITSTGTGKYVIRDQGRNDGAGDVILDEGYGIVRIVGLNRRAVPRTSIDVATLFNLLDPQIETPNVVPKVGTND